MPSLADLRFAAQSQADRINASTITAAEWNIWVNYGVQELYGILTSAYQDYNVRQYPFTLAGGANGNSIQVGQGSGVPDFFQPRAMWRQIMNTGGNPMWATVLRLNSLLERNLHVGPSVSLLYGQLPVYWNLLGTTAEVLPPESSGGNYMLTYVPTMPKLVSDDQTVDQYWLGVNGWDLYAVKHAAIEALVKEESIETAAVLQQQKQALRERILRECAPRDDSQPGHIVDVKRVRNNFGFGSWDGRGGGW